jgi:hypothetical protein
MASFSYNEFFSSSFSTISASSEDPTVLIDAADVPSCGHIVVLSVFVSNKSDLFQVVNMGIRKLDEDDCAFMTNIQVPISQPFDLLRGSKIILTREDSLRMWTTIESQPEIEALVSYAIYTPSDLLVST